MSRLPPQQHHHQASAMERLGSGSSAAYAVTTGSGDFSARSQQQAHSSYSRPAGGPPACQVPGCTASLLTLRDYHLRYKVCEAHSMVEQLVGRDGELVRFCQQCGRFHPLSAFDGTKRSCRERLARHNARRRRWTSAKANASSGTTPTGAVEQAPLQKWSMEPQQSHSQMYGNWEQQRASGGVHSSQTAPLTLINQQPSFAQSNLAQTGLHQHAMPHNGVMSAPLQLVRVPSNMGGALPSPCWQDSQRMSSFGVQGSMLSGLHGLRPQQLSAVDPSGPVLTMEQLEVSMGSQGSGSLPADPTRTPYKMNHMLQAGAEDVFLAMQRRPSSWPAVRIKPESLPVGDQMLEQTLQAARYHPAPMAPMSQVNMSTMNDQREQYVRGQAPGTWNTCHQSGLGSSQPDLRNTAAGAMGGPGGMGTLASPYQRYDNWAPGDCVILGDANQQDIRVLGENESLETLWDNLQAEPMPIEPRAPPAVGQSQQRARPDSSQSFAGEQLAPPPMLAEVHSFYDFMDCSLEHLCN